MLDVVYNHVGASGNKALRGVRPVLHRQVRDVLGRGDQLRRRGLRRGARVGPARAPSSWVRDFHVDGLRLDAIHAIFDTSARAPRRRARAPACTRRSPGALVIAESGLNDPKVMRPPERGGWGCDAAWADDFHHALRTLLTGEREGYYAEFGAVARPGQGVPPPARPRRHLVDVPQAALRRAGRRPAAASAFVVFDQNHDQVGNRALGDRLPAEARPLAAFVHAPVAPFTPMLFMGEEYGERRAVPVLHRPHRRGDRRRHARGAPARVRRLRRVRRRGGARPAGPRRRSSARS